MKIEIVNISDEMVEELKDELVAYRKGKALQMWRVLTLLESQIIQNIRKNSGLHVGTGALMNSIKNSKKVWAEGDYLVASIGPEGVPYANIQEDGGTIVPKDKEFLAVPTRENRRRDGMPKITTEDLRRGLIPSFINKGMIFGIISGTGKTAQAMALFSLNKSVQIPARPYLSTAMTTCAPLILENFGMFLSASFNTDKA